MQLDTHPHPVEREINVEDVTALNISGMRQMREARERAIYISRQPKDTLSYHPFFSLDCGTWSSFPLDELVLRSL
jgi:hypothetical protein